MPVGNRTDGTSSVLKLGENAAPRAMPLGDLGTEKVSASGNNTLENHKIGIHSFENRRIIIMTIGDLVAILPLVIDDSINSDNMNK